MVGKIVIWSSVAVAVFALGMYVYLAVALGRMSQYDDEMNSDETEGY